MNTDNYLLARVNNCSGASSSLTSQFNTFSTRRLYSLTLGVKTAKECPLTKSRLLVTRKRPSYKGINIDQKEANKISIFLGYRTWKYNYILDKDKCILSDKSLTPSMTVGIFDCRACFMMSLTQSYVYEVNISINEKLCDFTGFACIKFTFSPLFLIINQMKDIYFVRFKGLYLKK